MTGFDMFTIAIDKATIEKLDFTLINEFIEERWDIGYNTLNISFLGYDNDSREIFEIPEIQKWVKYSMLEEKIPWFFFLSKDTSSSSIKALALCYCAEPVMGENGTIKFQPMQNKIQEFCVINFSNMNDFMKEYEFNDSLKTEASILINEYFNNWLGG
jgi:hypothetical protein